MKVGGDPEVVKKSEERRFHKKEEIEKLMELDKEWRQERFKLDNANKDFKNASKEVGLKKKAKEDAEEEIKVAGEKKLVV